MAHTLLQNIGKLCGILPPGTQLLKGKAMSSLSTIDNAWLKIENGLIHSFGPMSTCPSAEAPNTFDLQGRHIIPAFADSHTHIVFAAWRESEFVDRIKGLTYEEIAQRGGGILNSAQRLENSSEDELFEFAMQRLHEVIRMGTAAIEIKSGYGLSTAAELKMLRVIKKIKQENIIPVKATFLGAHALPAIYKNNRQAYINLILHEMIPAIAQEQLADYIDVFCDRGFFTVDETDQILEAGTAAGLIPKIHANELDYSGGIQIGVKHRALSVDHLEYTGDDEIQCLLQSNTMPTLLPSTAFFLKLPYAPARKMIDAGLPIALASDYNPGSSPSGCMPFVLSLACIHMNMTPEEALNAATINSAYAMGLQDEMGSITQGKRANLAVLKANHHLHYMCYAFTKHHVDYTYINGIKQNK